MAYGKVSDDGGLIPEW